MHSIFVYTQDTLKLHVSGSEHSQQSICCVMPERTSTWFQYTKAHSRLPSESRSKPCIIWRTCGAIWYV